MKSKRIFALLLTLCLLLSLAPAMALAEGESAPEAQPIPNETQGLNYGYYLIGRYGWTASSLVESRDKFTQNYGASATEYKLITTLEEGQELKVVLISGEQISAWYPSAGGNYVVDAAHAGTKIIYFRPDYNPDWAQFGGHIWIDDPPVYNVYLEQPAHGALVADKASAIEGETVTITAIPDEGYFPNSIRSDDWPPNFINSDPYTATFTMPAKNVTVYMWTNKMYPAAGFYFPNGTNVNDLSPSQRFTEESTAYGDYYYDAELTEGQEITVFRIFAEHSWSWSASSSVTVTAEQAGAARIYLSLTERDGYTPIMNDVWLKVGRVAETCTVSFDAGEGTVNPASVEVTAGEAVGELPTPTREGGWVFMGWFAEPAPSLSEICQGTAVTAETVFTENATVYAHWRLPGDVNGDGKVNTADVTLLAKYVKARGQGITLVPGSGNIDGDMGDKVNTADVTLLAKFVKARGKGIVIH